MLKNIGMTTARETCVQFWISSLHQAHSAIVGTTRQLQDPEDRKRHGLFQNSIYHLQNVPDVNAIGVIAILLTLGWF
jgi:hypothetical protein